jgi:transcriptional regulator with XRE-family HTH domain
MIVIYKKEGMYVMTRKIVLDIKALRKEKNMTISELANRLNKTIFEIKVWEDNGHKVSIKDLDSLHQILGFSINYVVFNNERNILSVRGLPVKQIQLLLKLIEEISGEEY